jgi:single-stranded DNA-binding protein
MGVNHCLLEVEVLEAPQLRYTQDNQTPVAEMTVRFDGLRVDDAPGQIKVVGWGSLAQDLQNRVQIGQRLLLEGRLRINSVGRPDGVKEKRAEFTLARLHPIAAGAPAADPFAADSRQPSSASAAPGLAATAPAAPARRSAPAGAPTRPMGSGPAANPGRPPAEQAPPVWNTSPLVADPEGFQDEDDIPF